MRRYLHLLQGIEQAPRITIGQCGQRLQGIICHVDVWHGIQCALRQLHQFIIGQRMQHIHLRPREQGRIDFKRRVFGRGADKHHQPRFDKGQQSVLLAFVEAVNLVNEQNGAAPLCGMGLRLFHGGANVFHTAEHSRQRNERIVKRVRHQARQRGFTHAGRPPQNHGVRLARGKSRVQGLARCQQMRLANHLVKTVRPQQFGQWCAGRMRRGSALPARCDSTGCGSTRCDNARRRTFWRSVTEQVFAHASSSCRCGR